MIRRVRFNQDYRCFKKGDEFEFRPGVNLLVGDQGVGKSSLFQVIQFASVLGSGPGKGLADVTIEADPLTTLYSFDFEKENPRTEDMRTSRRPFRFNLASRFHSHGQTVNRLLAQVENERSVTFLMDEPDMALSVRSIAALAERFARSALAGNQIIAAVHNPFLIASFEEVYSLEHRAWLFSRKFIESLWSEHPWAHARIQL